MGIVAVEEFLSSNKARLAPSEDGMFSLGKLMLNEGIVVEVQTQMLVNALIHPVFSLLVAAIVKKAISTHEVDILIDHVPHLLDAIAIETAIAEHLRLPAALRLWEEMEGVAEIGGRHLTAVYIVTIALVDDDAVADFHNITLDALQFIASAGYLDEQEEVDHRMAGGLALSHADGLYEDFVVACRLAEDDGLAGLTSHTAQRAS